MKVVFDQIKGLHRVDPQYLKIGQMDCGHVQFLTMSAWCMPNLAVLEFKAPALSASPTHLVQIDKFFPIYVDENEAIATYGVTEELNRFHETPMQKISTLLTLSRSLISANWPMFP